LVTPTGIPGPAGPPGATGAAGPAGTSNANNGTSISSITPGTVVFGNDVAGNLGQLISHREVPMNNFSLIFSDNPPATIPPNSPGRPNTVTIGHEYSPFVNAYSKFYTENLTELVGGVFATKVSTGATVKFPHSTGNLGYTGAAGYAQSTGTTVDYLTGVYGMADNSNAIGGGSFICGVRGEAAGNSVTQRAIGVAGLAKSAQTGLSGVNIGVYGEAANGHTSWAGFMNGNSLIFGTWMPSDSLLKTNITTITNALAIIKKLNPKSYYFDTTNTYGLNLPSKKQYGFLAQNVSTILPELTTSFSSPADTMGPTNFTALNYNGFIGLLTAGMQQQQLSIDSLRGETALPTVPVLISPANGASGSFGKGNLTWNSVSNGIVVYHAQLATDNAFSNVVLDLSTTDTTTVFGADCDTVNVTYYWRVNAKNNAGTSAWSTVFSFTDTTKCGSSVGTPIRRIDAVAFGSASDSLFKTNVTPLTNALSKVTQLNGVYYDWLHNNPKYQFDTTNQVGFIAQDVKKVIPQVVSKDVNGYLALDYGKLAPVLVEAIKTLKTNNDSLQAQINRLTSLMNACCSSSSARVGTTTNLQSVTLSDKDAIVLNQNVPNPFAEQTVITYNIPENTGFAQLLFYDLNGRQIKTVDITTKGAGQLNVYANDLTNGMYSYTLIVDGKIIDTKKMVKQQ
jgi:hypothetical protein